jgi:hypothetical protein
VLLVSGALNKSQDGMGLTLVPPERVQESNQSCGTGSFATK